MNELRSAASSAERPPDRPTVIYDLLDEIATLVAEGSDPIEVDRLVAEYRRLRAEL